MSGTPTRILLVIVALAFFQALQADDTQSIEPAPTFEDNIGPLLAKSCYECHGEETQEAGLDLRTVSKIVFGGASGTALVPGKPAESYLWSMALCPVQTVCVLDHFLFLADKGFFDNRYSTRQGTWFKKGPARSM